MTMEKGHCVNTLHDPAREPALLSLGIDETKDHAGQRYELFGVLLLLRLLAQYSDEFLMVHTAPRGLGQS
jgi:hypothetical protein